MINAFLYGFFGALGGSLGLIGLVCLIRAGNAEDKKRHEDQAIKTLESLAERNELTFSTNALLLRIAEALEQRTEP